MISREKAPVINNKKMAILVYGMTNNLGGMEQFIHNYYPYLIDSFDFSFVNMYDKIFYQDEYEKQGNTVYKTANPKRNPFRHYYELKNILTNNGIDAIYVNMLSFANAIPIMAAKKAGVRIILHAHSTNANGVVKKVLHRLNRRFFCRPAQLKIACSDKSGKYMFGNQNYYVVQNAIDGKKYHFDKVKRAEIRNKYRIEPHEIVIGNIGRLSKEKNQKQLIDVLYELQKQKDIYKLMLVGDGRMKKDLMDYATRKNVIKKVIFTGRIKNSSDMYQAMDVFAMPSFYEGLSLTALEAQASGLPCIFTDNMDKGVDISGKSVFLPIGKKATSAWANVCLKLNFSKRINVDVDIKSSADILKEIISKALV